MTRWTIKQYLIAAAYVGAIALVALAVAFLMPKPFWMDP